MGAILTTAVILAITLAAIGYLSGRQNGAGKELRAQPLQLLPGDIKYESPNGNVRIYFPIATSIVLSIVLSLVMRLFG